MISTIRSYDKVWGNPLHTQKIQTQQSDQTVITVAAKYDDKQV